MRQWLSVTLARDPAIVADLDPGADHRVGTDLAAAGRAALHARSRHSGRCRNPSGTMAVGSMIAEGARRATTSARRIEGLRRERICLIGLVADEEGHAGWRLFGGLFIDEGGAGARADKCFDVLSVFEKADLCRSRGFERRHIAEEADAVFRAQQSGSTQGAQHIKCKRSGSIKKPSVRHLRLGPGSECALFLLLFWPAHSQPAAPRWRPDPGGGRGRSGHREIDRQRRHLFIQLLQNLVRNVKALVKKHQVCSLKYQICLTISSRYPR